MRFFVLAFSYLLLAMPNAAGQHLNYTQVRGTVLDKSTKLPISYATISVPGLSLGQITDENGHFALKSERKFVQIKISALGYRSQTLEIKSGQNQTLEVWMESESKTLQEVTVKPPKYRNKNNPAVELIQRVIEHRDENHLEMMDSYHDEQYEKIFLGIQKVGTKVSKHKMLRGVRFFMDNTDTSKLGGASVIPMFLQENLMDFYSISNPKKWRKYIKASQSVKFPGLVDQSGMNRGLQYIYKDIDIYDNYITLLTDQFLSPIAKNAPLFYRYYPQDTTLVAGKKIVRLEFYPRNKYDMLLQGEMYIALDSSYPVTGIQFTINPRINLNWVNDLSITQEYQHLPSGKWVVSKENYQVSMGITQGSVGMLAERMVVHQNPEINVPLPDSLFDTVEELVYLRGAEKSDTAFWSDNRPTPLNQAEANTYANMDSLQRTKLYKITSKILYILIGAYSPMGKKLEIGPLNSFFAFNDVEGSRLRVGGRTSTGFSEQFRLEAYTAYGFKDDRWKYRLGGVYALPGSKFNKFPNNLIRVNLSNDVIVPGQSFQGTGSNVGNSFVRGPNNKFLNNNKLNIQYEREYENRFSFQTGILRQEIRPLGALQFVPVNDENPVGSPVMATAGFLQLRYAPGEKIYQGTNGRLLIDFNYIATLRYSSAINGFLNGQYNYHELTASFYKFTNTPPLGYNYTYIEAGALLGQAPYPLLTVHRGNQSYLNLSFSYNLMNFMEFISDRYVMFMTEQYFHGAVFNKIPVFRRLKMREVCTFKMIYGGVSRQNQPQIGANNGLFKFPSDVNGVPISYSLDQKPYVEASVGVSNILRLIRIDYIRRFNYLDHPNVAKYGIRVSLVSTF